MKKHKNKRKFNDFDNGFQQAINSGEVPQKGNLDDFHHEIKKLRDESGEQFGKKIEAISRDSDKEVEGIKKNFNDGHFKKENRPEVIQKKVYEDEEDQKPVIIVAKENLKKEDENKPSFFLKWQAPEYDHFKKDVSWYWISLIVTAILIIIAIWQRNFMFALFLVIAWPVLIFITHEVPKMWDFELDEDGIKIGENKFYHFSEILGFDINNYNEDYAELVLRVKSNLNPFVRIRVPINDKDEMEEFLLGILPRQEYPETLSEIISKLLKF